jgi:hypothetical protein
MTGLRISDDLSLPLDAITQTLVVYGGKGKGKTNFGAVLAEELYQHDLKFSALDPYGVMWGLRHSNTDNARSHGLEVLILGGLHGDLPILPTKGAVVADLVSDESISTVVDISRHPTGKMWGKAEKIRFVADYATRLFERQGEHQRPLMQIIDEAGRYCPQTIPHGSPELARCVGAIEELVEVGRNVGIGVTLITQRSARMNKSVSELAEAMVAFCTLGPNSVEAITDWCGEHIERARWKELVGEIRKLPRGTAMVVSPSWLNLEGKVVPIRARWTFDSSATPKAGARQTKPGRAAMPNLEAYRERMAEVEEEAKALDPRELRRQLATRDERIADLERRLAADTIEVEPPPAFDETEFRRLVSDATNLVRSHADRMVREANEKILERFDAYRLPLLSSSMKVTRTATVGGPRPIALPAKSFEIRTRTDGPPVKLTSEGTGTRPIDLHLVKGALVILTAIAQHPKGITFQHIMVLTTYRSRSCETYIGQLIQNGLIERIEDRKLRATVLGLQALGANFEPLPVGKALRDHYFETLPEGEKRVLMTIVQNHPYPVTKDDLIRATNYTKRSVETYAGKLATRKIVVNSRGSFSASESLFS